MAQLIRHAQEARDEAEHHHRHGDEEDRDRGHGGRVAVAQGVEDLDGDRLQREAHRHVGDDVFVQREDEGEGEAAASSPQEPSSEVERLQAEVRRLEAALAGEEAQHRQSKQQLEAHAQRLHAARQDLKETQRAFADFSQAGLDERGALLAARLSKSEGEAMRFRDLLQTYKAELSVAQNEVLEARGAEEEAKQTAAQLAGLEEAPAADS